METSKLKEIGLRWGGSRLHQGGFICRLENWRLRECIRSKDAAKPAGIGPIILIDY